MKSTTVSVNGTVYDSSTGKPLRRERQAHAATTRPAQSVHAQQQRSKTLARRYVKRDSTVTSTTRVLTSATAPARQVNAASKIHATHTISRHRAPATPRVAHTPNPAVAKFAKPVAPAAAAHHKQPQAAADLKPTPHALELAAAKKVQAVSAARQGGAERAVRPSQVIKNESIAHAIAGSTPKHHKKEVRSKKQRSKAGRLASVASASLAIVLLGGYLTYLNMPALSTRVAAAQAGIDASYPSYSPSGYSLSGPVAYSQGSVSMKFAANAGPRSYTLTQKDSTWDSTAVLENAVEPEAKSDYTTTTASGLTIYTYKGKSVWVNNGILYTITGDASLSGEQVRNIATSL